MISSLNKDLRATGNSLSNIFMNLLGFLPAPFVYGIINDSAHPNKRVAFTVVLNYAFLGCLLLLISVIVRNRNFKENEENDNKVENIMIAVEGDSKVENSQQVKENII